MAGISTTAPLKLENRFKYNGIELNHKEFSDESGLDLYSAYFRSLDPQIGRWLQVDPRTTYNLSPYASMNLNPVLLFDILGDTTGLPDAYKGSYNIYSNNILDELIVGGYGNSNYGMNGPLYTGVFFAPTKFIKDNQNNTEARNLVGHTESYETGIEKTLLNNPVGGKVSLKVYSGVKIGEEKLFNNNIAFFNKKFSSVEYGLGAASFSLTSDVGLVNSVNILGVGFSFGVSPVSGLTFGTSITNGKYTSGIETSILPSRYGFIMALSATFPELIPELSSLIIPQLQTP